MSEKKTEGPDSASLRSLTDDEIVTERRVARRSFLSTTGAVVAGAVGIVSGARAAGRSGSPQDDPDKKPVDPDKRPDDARKKADDARKREDDLHKRPEDQKKREDDPNKRPADPDKRPDDPHR